MSNESENESENEDEFVLTTDSIDQWERLTDLMREVRQARDELRSNIIRALAHEEPDQMAGWIATTRVRVVSNNSVAFSVSELREKYGDEWVEENSKRGSSATLEIKTMARGRPVGAYEIPSPVEA
tara:strand:- start:136 stop:513 length:378 start_codon:yes stop_codon:yes gene_type:complete